MIRFREFQKSYGHKLVVGAEDLALDAPFYWLRGGNGSGKTTLLRAIAGIIPFRGRIEVGGKSAQKDPVRYRRAVSTAAAEPAFPDFLTGEDLLQLFTQTKKGTDAATADLVAQLGIGGFVKDKIGTYSSGMKKKLSLALAFIGAPELILLDEPLITLDAASVTLLPALMERHLEAGAQLLITSHQDIVLPFAALPQSLIIEDRELKPAQ